MHIYTVTQDVTLSALQNETGMNSNIGTTLLGLDMLPEFFCFSVFTGYKLTYEGISGIVFFKSLTPKLLV